MLIKQFVAIDSNISGVYFMYQKPAQSWSYSLPIALSLMVPFDLLASLAMDVYLPVVPLMPAALNTSSFIIQLTLSTYILILGAGQLFFGPISDRLGRRPIVLGGASVFVIASFTLGTLSQGGVFLFFRVMQALGASAALVGMYATIRYVYGSKPESSTIYGLLSSILAFVPAIGPILGAVISVNFGWRAIFYTLGGLGILSLLNAWPKWYETRSISNEHTKFDFLSILTNKRFWIYTLGFSSAMGTFFVFFSIAPRILINQIGLSQIEFSIAFSSLAFIMIITARFSSWFVKNGT